MGGMQPSPEDIAEMFKTVSLGSPEHAVGFVMWRMTHRFQREVDQAMRQLDLTHLQFTVLAMAAWTNRGGYPVVQAEIARFGEIHPMQVSLVLKALERKGMIRRATRRGVAKVVSVTSPGLEVLRAAMPIAIAVQRRLFGKEGRPGGVLLETLLRVDRRQK